MTVELGDDEDVPTRRAVKFYGGPFVSFTYGRAWVGFAPLRPFMILGPGVDLRVPERLHIPELKLINVGNCSSARVFDEFEVRSPSISGSRLMGLF
ncbi:hypothetical protein AVEN_42684-1 [Araneus ventricosus]|uniref:Uncharacterized protein n=1 Tax=Araneus ventricosus TaxID=182803 RepID=A0A4Y2BPN4_ARAVE|nr:hypothetical protein AVEN_42684-1 [Araneus ventricosus]